MESTDTWDLGLMSHPKDILIGNCGGSNQRPMDQEPSALPLDQIRGCQSKVINQPYLAGRVTVWRVSISEVNHCYFLVLSEEIEIQDAFVKHHILVNVVNFAGWKYSRFSRIRENFHPAKVE